MVKSTTNFLFNESLTDKDFSNIGIAVNLLNYEYRTLSVFEVFGREYVTTQAKINEVWNYFAIPKKFFYEANNMGKQ